nr:MAG TPA: hypothetical protein [Siphoviridae sp. ctX8T1]
MMETTPRNMVHIFVLVTGTWIQIQTPGYDRGVEPFATRCGRRLAVPV